MEMLSKEDCNFATIRPIENSQQHRGKISLVLILKSYKEERGINF